MYRIAAVALVAVTVLVVGVTSAVRSDQGRDVAIASARVERDPDNALRGTLTVRTEEPTSIAVELRSEEHGLRVVPTTGADTTHEVPLLQLLPQTAYTVHVQVGESEPDGSAVRVGQFATGALPDDLPPIEVTSDPERMSPGLTLFDGQYRAPEGEEPYDDNGWMQVVDAEGRVVWYHREPLNIQDVRRQPDGDLLYVSDETGARLMSPTGDVKGEWRGSSPKSAEEDLGAGLEPGEEVVDVDVHSMHHEVLELPNGNYLTLSREIREVAYPEGVCEEHDDDAPPFDGTYDVVGDAVIEFDPETGEVVKDYSLFDVLDPADDDPLLAEDDFCIDYLDQHYPDRQPRDWTHANAVVLDEADNALVLSLRHTDQVLALRYADDEEGPGGELLWSMGPYDDEGLELVGDGEWFYHQHAPELQPDGTILLYDNGTHRPLDEGEANYSRPVRYRVDPEAGEVEQVWDHVAEAPYYASFLGDADGLDAGTVLSTHGGSSIALEDADGTALAGWLAEVDEATGETVFELETSDPEGGAGWAIYRAERIPTIYPAGYEVRELWAPGAG